MSELLSCPFCGEKARIDRYEHFYRVLCTDCPGMTEWSYSEQEAIKDWNRRVERTCRNLCKQVDDNGEKPINNGICFICSECDAYVRDAEGYHSGLYPDYCDTGFKYDIAFSYCPNCGAKVINDENV